MSLILAQHTLRIDRSIHDVFDYVSNHEHYADWFPGVLSVTSDSAPQGTIGKTYFEKIRLPTGRTREIRIPVTQYDRPSLFVTEGVLPPLHPRMEIRLRQDDNDATILRWIFSSRSTSRVTHILLRLFVKRQLNRQSTQAMHRLKATLESGDNRPVALRTDRES